MNDALIVGRLERVGDLPGNGEGLLNGTAPRSRR